MATTTKKKKKKRGNNNLLPCNLRVIVALQLWNIGDKSRDSSLQERVSYLNN